MCADLQEGELEDTAVGRQQEQGLALSLSPWALQSSHTWGVLADLCILCALKAFPHPLCLPMLWLCCEPEVNVNFRALLAVFG